eukprot:gnl/Chilomastix_caulleri/848.p3 GENE.gnl/Chilomastix_caulleri/848~~gnl/Chilomastix_caulleri/848.p3  ORF type:complete len:57 (+),score=6.70 gnl/Chilomastix_caulleri/848:389-559(+)
MDSPSRAIPLGGFGDAVKSYPRFANNQRGNAIRASTHHTSSRCPINGTPPQPTSWV